MKAIGMMMVEHRLIERMVKLMAKELQNEELKRGANTAFIYMAVDFFRTYADRTHHGKEEDILFAALGKKPMLEEHQKIMNSLIAEHKVARENVLGLYEAAERYDRGDAGALEHIINHLKRLVALYPPHIEKEDRHFFFPAMEYFTEEEKAKMLLDCEEFDRKMIHEKYVKLVEQYEGK